MANISESNLDYVLLPATNKACKRNAETGEFEPVEFDELPKEVQERFSHTLETAESRDSGNPYIKKTEAVRSDYPATLAEGETREATETEREKINSNAASQTPTRPASMAAKDSPEQTATKSIQMPTKETTR